MLEKQGSTLSSFHTRDQLQRAGPHTTTGPYRNTSTVQTPNAKGDVGRIGQLQSLKLATNKTKAKHRQGVGLNCRMLCKYSRVQLASMLNVLGSSKDSTTQVQCLALGTTKSIRCARYHKCRHTSRDILIQICTWSNQCQPVNQRLMHGRIRDKQ